MPCAPGRTPRGTGRSINTTEVTKETLDECGIKYTGWKIDNGTMPNRTVAFIEYDQ